MTRFVWSNVLTAGFWLFAGSADAVTATDFLYRNHPPAAGQYPYRIYVPTACKTSRCPVLVFLHGLGQIGTDNEKQLNGNASGSMQLISEAKQAIQPMIMVAPQTDGQGNWVTAKVVDILDDVYAEFPYDRDRIYLTGYSLGGGGTWDAVLNYDKVFAAAVPLAAPGSSYGVKILTGLPFWAFHGGADKNNDPSTAIKAIRDAGGDPSFTVFNAAGHGISTASYATPKLFQWLIAQRRGRGLQLPDPFVRIDTPTAQSQWETNASTVNLAGTAGGADAGISSIRWTAGSSSGSASGTSNWQAAAIPVAANTTTVVRMQGTGVSYNTNWPGKTEFSDTLRVRSPASTTNQPPRVKVISEPLVRYGQKVEFTAIASDDGKPGALQVTWGVYGSPSGVSLQVNSNDPWRATVVSAPVGSYRIAVHVSDGNTSVTHYQRLMVVPATGPLQTVIAINAGGPAYTAKDGTQYIADDYFTAGDATSDTVKMPIYGTRDDALYQDYRLHYWEFGYEIPLPNGRYYVILHFAETYNPVDSDEGQTGRLMKVTVDNPVLPNETQMLDDLSIYQLVGHRYALRYGIFADVKDGKLRIKLDRKNGMGERARIDAIQVLKRVGW